MWVYGRGGYTDGPVWYGKRHSGQVFLSAGVRKGSEKADILY